MPQHTRRGLGTAIACSGRDVVIGTTRTLPVQRDTLLPNHIFPCAGDSSLTEANEESDRFATAPISRLVGFKVEPGATAKLKFAWNAKVIITTRWGVCMED
jgi:hypothetical protein